MVKEYTFHGESVYVFDSDCEVVGGASAVIDSDCNELGYLVGISGNTKIYGEDFLSATFVNMTWEK